MDGTEKANDDAEKTAEETAEGATAAALEEEDEATRDAADE